MCVAEIIDNQDVVPGFEKFGGCVTSDETQTSGDKHILGLIEENGFLCGWCRHIRMKRARYWGS
jgi:hypothetical protein